MPDLRDINHAIALIRLAEAHGLDYEPLWAMVNLKQGLAFLPEGVAPMNLEDYRRLCLVVRPLLKRSDSPDDSFQIMGRYAISAETLREALVRMQRFYKMLMPDTASLVVSESGDSCHVSFEVAELPLPDLGPYSQLWPALYCANFLNFLCWLIDSPIPLRNLGLGCDPPRNDDIYQRLFACPIHFGDENMRLTFDSGYLDKPVLQQEMALEELFDEWHELFAVLPYKQRSASERVLDYMTNSLPDLPSLDRAAAAVNMSVSTLRRQLQQDGVNFQGIKDQCRFQLARYLLSHTELDLAAIAVRVGYSDSSNFQLAFKKWAGLTPGAYRARET